MKRSALAWSVVVIAIAPAACGGAAAPAPSPASKAIAPATSAAPSATQPAPSASSKDVVDTLASLGSFTTLQSALAKAGLADTLKGAGPFTLFAPTDDAFKKVPADKLAAIMADGAKLKAVLAYHVAKNKLAKSALAPMHSLKTMHGDYLAIASGDGGALSVNEAPLADPTEASNGLVYTIDRVLLPPENDDDATP
jgi:uncharacterized surface protein with fasciclin (FAS1) repeats